MRSSRCATPISSMARAITRRGLKFPGDERPDYWDFVYFAFVIGMTFQMSDVGMTSKHVRRMVLVHGMVAFVFTTTIIALTVNLAASAFALLPLHDHHHPDSALAARRDGGGCGRGAPSRYRAVDPAGDRRRRAGADPRPAAHRAGAGTRAPGAAAAAHLFGRRLDELARVPLQPAADRAARGRLRRVHHLRGRSGRALAHRPAVGGRLPARRDRGAARRGRAARDRSAARTCRGGSSWCSKAKAWSTMPPP